MCPAPRSQPRTKANALSMTRRFSCSGKLTSTCSWCSGIRHHRPVVCGCVRVWMFCDVSESLPVFLPFVRKDAVLHRAPVRFFQC